MLLIGGVLTIPTELASAQDAAAPRQPKTIASFSVGPDQTLVYPTDLLTLPDEHTTFIPQPGPAPSYLVFASSSILGGHAGTVVLQTSDLKNFIYAPGYTSPVMQPPVPFNQCNATYDQEFDENYSAPGTVLQDPTRPPGHFIMFYEAENHCPGGIWQRQYYATVGMARSHDYGKTWPAPINAEFGGPGRRPVLKSPEPEPTTHQPSPIYMGNAIPSAFLTSTPDGEHRIYVTYDFHGTGADGFLRVARAKLGTDHPLRFEKWDNGSFSQPGIGGTDSRVLPSLGCTAPAYQTMGQISYNRGLDQFLLTFVCISLQGQPGARTPYQAAWYYATATSLHLQDWTTPQLIANSQFPVVAGCASDGSGASFDGWYPSLVSPGVEAGHTHLTGQVFFMNGCDTGLQRKFMSRTFTITTN